MLIISKLRLRIVKYFVLFIFQSWSVLLLRMMSVPYVKFAYDPAGLDSATKSILKI